MNMNYEHSLDDSEFSIYIPDIRLLDEFNG